MEVFIFAQIGAWKSLEELEDSLILPELLEFVSACRRSDLDEQDYGFSEGPVKEAASGFEVSHLPIGVGFTEE